MHTTQRKHRNKYIFPDQINFVMARDSNRNLSTAVVYATNVPPSRNEISNKA